MLPPELLQGAAGPQGQIEELEETLGSREQGGSIEDHGSMLSQVQATIKLFREELKRRKFRKLYFP